MVDRTEVDIDVSVNGTSSLQKAADVVSQVNQSLRATAIALNTVVTGLDRLEKSLATAGRTGKRNIDSLTQAVKQYQTASFNMTPPRDSRGRFASQGFIDEVEKRKTSASNSQALRTQIHNQKQIENGLRAASLAYFQAAFAGEKYAGFIDGVSPKQQSFFTQLKNGTATLKGNTGGLISLRYALYDVATSYGVAAAALLGFVGLSLKTAADFESAFTNVERTLDFAAGSSSTAIESIRQDLINLSTTIPLTFKDITDIAALGNQLGIASEDIVEFTKVTAQFSAVTGISVQESAQAFGLLGNLLDVSADQFDNLGSSIALVAKTSAATDVQIISTAEQIAAGAAGAGFAADQVIGLAGALASLKVPPEQARGSLSIYFNKINSAVAQGGPALQNFAAITGLTTQKITELVRSGKGGDEVLRAFLEGLNSTDSVGITQALDELGLSQVRVDNTFRRLAGGLDIYDQSMGNSAKGYREATELSDQYALVLDNLNTQFKLLINALDAWVAEVTGGAVPGLSALVGEMVKAVNAAREFAASDLGRTLSAIIVPAITLLGLFAAYRAATALATAATLALVTAQAQLAAIGTVGGIRGLISALGLISVGASGAAAKVLTLRAAVIALGKATVVLAAAATIFDIFTNFEEAADGLAEVTGGFAGLEDAVNSAAINTYDFGNGLKIMSNGSVRVGNQLIGLRDIVLGLISPLALVANLMNGVFRVGKGRGAALAKESNTAATATDAWADSLNNLGGAAGGAGGQVRTLVDYANDLSQVFSRATDIRFGPTSALDQVKLKFIELNEQLKEYQAQVLKLQADRAIQEYFLTIANAFGDTLRAGEIQATLAQNALDLAAAQAVTNKTLKGNSKAAITNRGVIVDLLKGYQDYISNLAASGASQATLTKAVKQSRLDFIAQAQALGFSNTELQPYIASFNDLTYAIKTVPRNVTVGANTNPAVTAVRELLSKISSGGYGSATVPIKTPLNVTSYKKLGITAGNAFKQGINSVLKTGLVGKKGLLGTNSTNTIFVTLNGIGGLAGGGFVRGGGTTTSDSVPIMASRNEFMLRAAAAQSLGPAVLNYMNRYGALPGFATGGFIGEPSGGASSFGSTVELGPRTLRYIATSQVPVYLDGREITTAVNKQNALRGVRGTG